MKCQKSIIWVLANHSPHFNVERLKNQTSQIIIEVEEKWGRIGNI